MVCQLLSVSLADSGNNSYLVFLFEVEQKRQIIYVNTSYLICAFFRSLKDKDSVCLKFSKRILELKRLEAMSPDNDFYSTNQNLFSFYCPKNTGESILKRILFKDTNQTA